MYNVLYIMRIESGYVGPGWGSNSGLSWFYRRSTGTSTAQLLSRVAKDNPE